MPLIDSAPAKVELHRREQLRQLDQLHAEAQVGLVHAVAIHRLVQDVMCGIGSGRSRYRLGCVEHRLADGLRHVVLVDEVSISASSCMNSYCRSARSIPSRRQRAIWKYRSTPAAIGGSN